MYYAWLARHYHELSESFGHDLFLHLLRSVAIFIFIVVYTICH